MTLVVAWLRAVADTKEIIIVADSRLTGAGYVDYAQKLFILPRGDCCLAFCGDSLLSYPIFIMVQSAITNYPRGLNRAQDISDLKNNVLNLINFYVRSWKDVLDDEFLETCRRTRFLLVGWSWKNLDFLMYEFFFSKIERAYRVKRSHYLRRLFGNIERNRQLVTIGDYRPALLESLSREMTGRDADPFNYEPLTKMRDMLKDPRFVDRAMRSEFEDAGKIGGPPQVVKIYSSGTSLPHAVWWPIEGEMKVHLLGRPLLDYEVTHFPIWDLDRMSVQYPLETVRNEFS